VGNLPLEADYFVAGRTKTRAGAVGFGQEPGMALTQRPLAAATPAEARLTIDSAANAAASARFTEASTPMGDAQPGLGRIDGSRVRQQVLFEKGVEHALQPGFRIEGRVDFLFIAQRLGHDGSRLSGRAAYQSE
jgi:hypothetical protein